MTDKDLLDVALAATTDAGGLNPCISPPHCGKKCECNATAKRVIAAVRPLIEAAERGRCAKFIDDNRSCSTGFFVLRFRLNDLS
jgi:hypothetical protein